MDKTKEFKFPRKLILNILKEEMMYNWQDEWSTGKTGRKIYKILQVTTNPFSFPRQIILILTGHGPFPLYPNFICKKLPFCACGTWGDPEHYIYHCPLTECEKREQSYRERKH